MAAQAHNIAHAGGPLLRRWVARCKRSVRESTSKRADNGCPQKCVANLGHDEVDVGAVNVLASPILWGTRGLIIDKLREARLPSIHEWPEVADQGGFIGYGAPFTSLVHRVAVLVDKVLRGARPADLPIEQPTKFELAVNLQAARAIGLAIPPLLLLRADRVVE